MNELGKVKEWHLDDAIRLKLSGQGVPDNFDEIMSDYIKKTDTIAPSNIDPSILNPAYDRISALSTELEHYRNISVPIKISDLDSELQTKLEMLEMSIGALPDDFGEIVEQAIDDVVSTQEFKETIANKVSQDIADLSDEVDTLHDTIVTAANSVSDMENSIATIQADLNQHIIDANEVFRYKNEKIPMEDLSDSLLLDLNEYKSNIQSLQSAVSSLQRVNFVNYDICTINIAETSSDLATLKEDLAAPILYVPAQILFDIDHDVWNKFASSTYNEPYIKILPDESTEELEFSDATITTENIVTQSNLTTSINDGNIVVTNTSATKYNTFVFGFYGGNIRLQLNVQVGEEESSEEPSSEVPAVILFNINIDGQAFPFRLEDGIDADPMDTFIIAELSTGPHRVEIPLVPNGKFTMNATIGLDDIEHSGLLLAADVPDAEFFDGNIYDDGDYFDIESSAGASTYTFTKTDDFEPIDENHYTVSQFDLLAEDGKLIYSPHDHKLYTFKNRKLICLS